MSLHKKGLIIEDKIALRESQVTEYKFLSGETKRASIYKNSLTFQHNSCFEISQSHFYLVCCDIFESTIFGHIVSKECVTPLLKKLSSNFRWCQIIACDVATCNFLTYLLHTPNKHPVEHCRLVASIAMFSLDVCAPLIC